MDTPDPAEDRPRVFLTCSARAQATLSPLLDVVERVLHDAGWSTRMPRRSAAHEILDAEDLRRVRMGDQREIVRSLAVVHVMAGATMSGVRLHHELAFAVKKGIPIFLLVAEEVRRRLGIEAPDPGRVERLQQTTEGTVVPDVVGLPAVLAGRRRARSS